MLQSYCVPCIPWNWAKDSTTHSSKCEFISWKRHPPTKACRQWLSKQSNLENTHNRSSGILRMSSCATSWFISSFPIKWAYQMKVFTTMTRILNYVIFIPQSSFPVCPVFQLQCRSFRTLTWLPFVLTTSHLSVNEIERWWLNSVGLYGISGWASCTHTHLHVVSSVVWYRLITTFVMNNWPQSETYSVF